MEPCSCVVLQDPNPELDGRAVVVVLQEFGKQVATVRIPVLQELSPETVYPGLQVGSQDCPEVKLLVQVPRSPLGGAILAPQGSAL